MIVFTRFYHPYLLKLSPEYAYVDIPRLLPFYTFSRRPPYRLKRSKDPLKLAKRLAEYLGEELVVSSRDLSSGTLYAEGLKIEYEYSGGILRRRRVEDRKETDEPYAIEGGRRILRPLSMYLLDYDAVLIEFRPHDGVWNERILGAPLPGVLYSREDPIRSIPITIRKEFLFDAYSRGFRRQRVHT